jgi:hypothetical protein
MMEANMTDKADCTLSDGQEVRFDLNRMTVREWRTFLGETTAEAEDALIERCAGLTAGAVEALGYDDWMTLTSAFYKRIKEARNPN